MPSWRKPDAGSVVATPQTSDEFDSPGLGRQWQWHANHHADWCSTTQRPGFLRVRALPTEPDLGATANLLLQKFPACRFAVETQQEIPSELDGQAGLIVVGGFHATLALERCPAGRRLVLVVDNRVTASVESIPPRCRLRVEVAEGGACRFCHAIDGGPWLAIGSLYQAGEGQWIEVKIGLFCRSSAAGGMSGHAGLDYFRFASPLDPGAAIPGLDDPLSSRECHPRSASALSAAEASFDDTTCRTC